MDSNLSIKLMRSELIWETRHSEFDEDNYNDLIESIKKACSSIADESDLTFDTPYYVVEAYYTYNAIKNISWAEAYEDFVKYEHDEEGCITWTIKRLGYKIVDGERVADPDDNREWTTSLHDVLAEEMRQMNYEAEIYGTDYADDSEERFYSFVGDYEYSAYIRNNDTFKVIEQDGFKTKEDAELFIKQNKMENASYYIHEYDVDRILGVREHVKCYQIKEDKINE